MALYLHAVGIGPCGLVLRDPTQATTISPPVLSGGGYARRVPTPAAPDNEMDDEEVVIAVVTAFVELELWRN